MRCFSPALSALILVSVWTSCVVVGESPRRAKRDAIPPRPMPAAQVAPPDPSRLTQTPIPGFEAGFTHCCGDFDHVMQVDCSDRLLRCYENQQGSWRQTYGRVCQKNLENSCYERGCLYACD